MNINFRSNLWILLMAALIFSTPILSFSVGNERRTVEVNGVPKQYDVIETKQYKIIEVQDPSNLADAPMSVEAQAIRDAEQDAAAHLNKTLWFTAGCFFPLAGPLVSQWYQPFMPTARVLGKPPEYIGFYYDAYKVKTKKLQYNWALSGCLVGLPTGACLLTILYNRTR